MKALKLVSLQFFLTDPFANKLIISHINLLYGEDQYHAYLKFGQKSFRQHKPFNDS